MTDIAEEAYFKELDRLELRMNEAIRKGEYIEFDTSLEDITYDMWNRAIKHNAKVMMGRSTEKVV